MEKQGKDVVPDPRLVFRPFVQTPLSKVKVVMVFPETYYLREKANGLALSFQGGRLAKLEDSPIFFYQVLRECMQDRKTKAPRTGDLSKWAKKGVLLWNSRPTTLEGHSGGHVSLGWEVLTKEVLETVYLVNPKAVFTFFGCAKDYAGVLPDDANILDLPLPCVLSPQSLEGTRIFSKINTLLKDNRKTAIDWSL